MRHPIDTAPKDGKFVILEDDVSGSFEFAQWSADARGWVRENGKPSEITPTHWQTMNLPQEGDEFILQDEFIPPKVTGSIAPPASQEPRSFRFPAGQAAAQRMADAGSLRQVANADPVTVARVGAQAAQGKSEREPRARRRFAVSSIAAAMVGASLIGWYFHAELAAYVTRYSGQLIRIGTGGVEVVEQETPVPIQDSQKADSLAPDPTLHQQADRANSQAPRDTAQVKQGAEGQQPLEKERRRAEAPANEQTARLSQAAETATSELRQSLQKEHDRAEALAGELAKARRETQQASPSKARDQTAQRNQAAEKATAELRQSLKTEHDRAEALTGELAKARRDLETQLALSSKAGDEAVQVKKAAETATAELRQSLKAEHDRAEALTGERAKARREVEAQAALSSKKDDEAAQLKRAAETAATGLQQSVRQERERAEALAGELAKAQREVKAEAALSSKKDDEAAQLKRATKNAQAELRQSSQQERDKPGEPVRGPKSTAGPVGARLPLAANSQTKKVRQAVAGSEQPAAAEANVNLEAARLVERANALLGQGNIGAARVVLERAAEAGSAQASFRLAETYDPLVLSTWGTYGTRGDATKARELYAKAYDGGIKAAKDRSDALQTAGSEAK